MFKKLKKAVSGKPQSQRSSEAIPTKAYAALSNSDTSSGDDSFYLPSAAQPVKPVTDQKTSAVLNQLVLNLGGDLGIMSLEHENGYASDENTVTDPTSATCYVTAVEGSDRTLRQDFSFKAKMDQSSASDGDTLCVTALDNTLQVENHAPHDVDTKPPSKDPLEDCLAAFGGLAIAPQANPSNALLSSVAETDGVRRLSDGSAFCVIDFDAEGKPVEHTLHYLPKAGNKTPKVEQSDIQVNISETVVKSESNPPGEPSEADVTDTMKQKIVDVGNTENTVTKNSTQPTQSMQNEVVSNVEKSVTNIANQMCNSNSLDIDDHDSDTAVTSESYKDSLPNLILPSALSNATSLDSTPFLTPEADITVSEFDPFASKPVEDDQNASTAPLAQPDTDGDTTTSSDTFTNQTGISVDPNLETPVSLSPNITAVVPDDAESSISGAVASDQVHKPSNIEDELLSMFSGMKIHEKDGTSIQSTNNDSTQKDDLPNNVGIKTNDEEEIFFEATTKVEEENQAENLESADQDTGLNQEENENNSMTPKAVDFKTKPSVLQERQNISKVDSPQKSKPEKIDKQDPSPLIEDQDELPISKGSYTIDFSQFEDPNFNPFATKQAVGNSPTHEKDAKTEDLFGRGDGLFNQVENSAQCSGTEDQGYGDVTETHKVNDDVHKSPSEDAIENSESQQNLSLADFKSMISESQYDETSHKTDAKEIKVSDDLTSLTQSSAPQVVDENVEQYDQEELTPLPKGTYSVNFDDPNFDPFQTKSSVSNNEVNVNFQTSSTTLGENQKTEEPVLGGKNQLTEIDGNFVDDQVNEKQATSNSPLVLLTSDEKPIKNVIEPDIETTADSPDNKLVSQEADEQEETLLPSRGAYTIDFSKFDDPNFNPFQTTKAISNEDITSSAIATVSMEKTPDAKKLESKSDSIEKGMEPPNESKAKTTTPQKNIAKKTKKKSPPKPQPPQVEKKDEDTIPVQRGAYSFDFSKFDDPNFDPFKTGKGLVNEGPTVPDDKSAQDNKLSPTSNQSNVESAPMLAAEVESEVTVNREVQSQVSPTQVLVDVLVSSEEQSLVQEPSLDEKPCISESANLVPLESSNASTVKTELSADKTVAEAAPKATDCDVEEKTMQTDTADIAHEESDVDVVTKGSYTMDYSKFDEPNFDPFKTNKGLQLDGPVVTKTSTQPEDYIVKNTDTVDSLPAKSDLISEQTAELKSGAVAPSVDVESEVSEVVENAEALPVKGAYSIDFSKLDDPNFDPFQTKPGTGGEGALNLSDPKEQENKDILKKTPPKKVSGNKVVKTEKPSPKVVEHVEEAVNDGDEIPIPKGAYSIDFSKFDDPNFDPFKIGKGLSNEEPALKTELTSLDLTVSTEQKVDKNKTASAIDPSSADDSAIVNKEKEIKPDIAGDVSLTVHEDSVESTDTQPSQKPSKKQVTKPWLKKKKKKPAEVAKTDAQDDAEEQPLAKGAYSIDFSKFDDPNYDPFKTGKGLSNEEPALKAELSTQDTTGSIEQKVEEPAECMDPSNIDESSNILKDKEDKTDFVGDKSSVVNEENVESSKKKSSTMPTKKQVTKPWLKKKKKKPAEVIKTDAQDDAEEQPLAKGAYSIDFSKFDDPNYDPFKTGKGLSNDGQLQLDKPQEPDVLPDKEVIVEKEPTPTKKQTKGGMKQKKKKSPVKVHHDDDAGDADEEPPLPKGAYSMDFSQFDDPNFDPFKTNKAISNEGTSQSSVSTELPEDVPSSVEAGVVEEKPKEKGTSPKKTVKNKQKKVVKKSPPPSEVGEDADSPPKGAYTIDFSKFDDPNFDPFKTSKGLSNDEPAKAMQDIVPPPANDEVVSDNKTKTQKLEKSPKKSVKKKKNIPKPAAVDDSSEDIPVSKGVYTIDYSQFDDPNFDPFKSKKALENDEDLSEKPATQEEVGDDTEMLDDTLTEEPTSQTLGEEAVGMIDEGFRPAEEVFESKDNLPGWEELWKKQDDAPQESLLNRQSLYVQFDPLVDKRPLNDNMIAFDGEHENVSSFGVQPHQINTVQTAMEMTSFEQSQLHPAATRLAQNLLNEEDGSWNMVETPTAKLLDLSFSPKMEASGKTTYSAVRSEVESSVQRYTEEECEELVDESTASLERENQTLRKLEEDLKRQLEEKTLLRQNASKDIKNKHNWAETELEVPQSQNEQSLKEFTSSLGMFDDYYRRNSKLMTSLITLKKADDELQEAYNKKAALLKSGLSKYSTLKKEANTTIARLNAEVKDLNSDAQRRVSAMEARIKKAQMTVSSLDKQLQNTIKENAELVKICDECVSHTDRK